MKKTVQLAYLGETSIVETFTQRVANYYVLYYEIFCTAYFKKPLCFSPHMHCILFYFCLLSTSTCFDFLLKMNKDQRCLTLCLDKALVQLKYNHLPKKLVL